jgi:hypothetical protein
MNISNVVPRFIFVTVIALLSLLVAAFLLYAGWAAIGGHQ